MQHWIKLLLRLTQRKREINYTNMLSVQRNTGLVFAFSLSLMIYFLATGAKVPIRITAIAPYVEIRIEINPDLSKSRFDFRQDVVKKLIASDSKGVNK